MHRRLTNTGHSLPSSKKLDSEKCSEGWFRHVNFTPPLPLGNLSFPLARQLGIQQSCKIPQYYSVVCFLVVCLGMYIQVTLRAVSVHRVSVLSGLCCRWTDHCISYVPAGNKHPGVSTRFLISWKCWKGFDLHQDDKTGTYCCNWKDHIIVTECDLFCFQINFHFRVFFLF